MLFYEFRYFFYIFVSSTDTYAVFLQHFLIIFLSILPSFVFVQAKKLNDWKNPSKTIKNHILTQNVAYQPRFVHARPFHRDRFHFYLAATPFLCSRVTPYIAQYMHIIINLLLALYPEITELFANISFFSFLRWTFFYALWQLKLFFPSFVKCVR